MVLTPTIRASLVALFFTTDSYAVLTALAVLLLLKAFLAAIKI